MFSEKKEKERDKPVSVEFSRRRGGGDGDTFDRAAAPPSCIHEVVSMRNISPHVPLCFTVILVQFLLIKLYGTAFHDLLIRAGYPSSGKPFGFTLLFACDNC